MGALRCPCCNGIDTVRAERSPTERLRHIAQLGFITRGWSYVNRGLDVPTTPVRVELISPSGATWEFGDADAPESIVGPALDFCLVTTQRRNVDDTALVVTGDAARDWMERAQLFAGLLLHFVGDFFLALVELPGLLSHSAHLLGKLAGCVLPELVAHLLQLALSARGVRHRPRDHPALELLGGLTNSGSAFIELLSGLSHALTVLGPFHSFLELIHVPKRFELLIPEPFEPAVDFFSLLLVLGLPKGRFRLLELVTHFALSPGQIAKAIMDLKVLALHRLFLRLGQPFRLVPILSLAEFQLLKLSLGTGRARRIACIGAATLPDLMFALF